MKKLFFFIITSFIIFFNHERIVPGFIANEDYRNQVAASQQQASSSSNAQNYIGQTCTTGNTQGTLQCCVNGCAQTENTSSSSLPIPNFAIQILDSSKRLLNGQTSLNGKIISSSNITSTALLIVQIFSPSNSIDSNSQLITFAGNQSYLIMYTIKDLAGLTVQTTYDLIPAANGVPFAINIPTIAMTTTQAGILPSSASGAAVFAPLFPTFSQNNSIKNSDLINFLNDLSPLTQKFLLTTTDNQNFSITPLSGTEDSGVSQSYTISGATSLNNISISFDGTTQLITFAGKAMPFSPTDLQKGAILNVIIYPSNNAAYRVVATLKTSDGAKYRKEYVLDNTNTNKTAPLSSIPSTIYISGPGISLTTRQFLNPNSFNVNTNANMFNMLAPINLEFRITP